MCDGLAIGRSLGKFVIGMKRVVIPSGIREPNDVRFRNGAARARPGLPDLQVFKREATIHRSVHP